MELVRSRSRADQAPRGGKRLLVEERKKSEEIFSDPSYAVINAIAQNSDMNGILTSYPFAPRNPMSNASIVGNPKTVREWANKKGSDFSKAFTDATITSSLMKKAQETAMNLKETAEDESNREHLRASVLASQLSQEALPNLPMMRDELLGYLDAAQSPALQTLFTSQPSEKSRQQTLKKNININSRNDLNKNNKTQ